jgi:hypothetical protein
MILFSMFRKDAWKRRRSCAYFVISSMFTLKLKTNVIKIRFSIKFMGCPNIKGLVPKTFT